jgi:hypothetical protein
MANGVAYIISNSQDRKHRKIFESMCNKSIKYVHKHLGLPTAILCPDPNDSVKADHIIDAEPWMSKYGRAEDSHGLILAELLKTHICEWSPFDRTLYIDCDALVMHGSAIDYLNVLDLGYELSVATCVTMGWKDSILDTSVGKEIMKNVISCFPYWNFGVFGSNKSSNSLLTKVREEFLKYCFGGWSSFKSCPHAQPALVMAAHVLSPNHKIFTMPARFNCHFAVAGGYVYSGQPVILHLWKDIRHLLNDSE